MRRKKKAQVIGQVFIYTFASLIFLIVLFFGYKAINGFVEQRNYVATIEMKTEITSLVHGIASSQTMREVSLTMPSGIREVCFIDLRKKLSDISPQPKLCKTHPLICSSWYDNVTKNVFFIPKLNLHINVGTISLANSTDNDRGFLCINVSNEKLYLKLEGQGDSTRISSWTI